MMWTLFPLSEKVACDQELYSPTTGGGQNNKYTLCPCSCITDNYSLTVFFSQCCWVHNVPLGTAFFLCFVWCHDFWEFLTYHSFAVLVPISTSSSALTRHRKLALEKGNSGHRYFLTNSKDLKFQKHTFIKLVFILYCPPPVDGAP